MAYRLQNSNQVLSLLNNKLKYVFLKKYDQLNYLKTNQNKSKIVMACYCQSSKLASILFDGKRNTILPFLNLFRRSKSKK